MSVQKFEKLIDLIINEDEQQARELFHDIVIEKSREIYESLMEDEMNMDKVGTMLDEIEADETMMKEDEEEFADEEEFDDGTEVASSEEEFSDEEVGNDEFEDDEGLEDRVVDLEDKLDDLIAEFEAMMGDEEAGEEEMDASDFDAEEAEEDADAADDEADMMAENVQLKTVKVAHGDNGAQTKSPALTKPRVVNTGAAPVNFSTGGDETVPTTAKKTNVASVKGSGQFVNVPGKDGSHGATAPKAKTETTKGVSPVAKS